MPYTGASGTGLPKKGAIYLLVSPAPYETATSNAPIELAYSHVGPNVKTD